MAGNNGSTFSTQAINTPAILSPSTGDTVLAANSARITFMIQNLGTNKLYVKFGTGATTSVFHCILAGCTAQDDGTGGSISMEAGTIYNGAISVAGTSPRLVVTEIAP